MNKKMAIVIAVIISIILIIIIKLSFIAKRNHLLLMLKNTKPSEKCSVINETYHLLDFRPGMTKKEVAEIIGDPQNRDNEYVWVWSCGSAGEIINENYWFDVFRSSGFYLVFYQEKLVNYISNTHESDPWDDLHNIGLDEQTVNKLIGPPPPWAVWAPNSFGRRLPPGATVYLRSRGDKPNSKARVPQESGATGNSSDKDDPPGAPGSPGAPGNPGAR